MLGQLKLRSEYIENPTEMITADVWMRRREKFPNSAFLSCASTTTPHFANCRPDQTYNSKWSHFTHIFVRESSCISIFGHASSGFYAATNDFSVFWQVLVPRVRRLLFGNYSCEGFDPIRSCGTRAPTAPLRISRQIIDFRGESECSIQGASVPYKSHCPLA